MSHDSDLQKAVLAELSWEPSVAAGHIGVTANSGIVALTGHVESYAQKHAAELAVRRVKGVKAVAEEIEIRLPYDSKRSDEDIAAAAVNRLAWNTSVPADAVTLSVENGWITLTGELDWRYQSEAAMQDVRHLLGVIGVSNQITIKPMVNTKTLSDDISHALGRSWFFDPQTVNVSAKDGAVKLTGTVRSWRDRDLAASTAWLAQGATSVENDLSIN